MVPTSQASPLESTLSLYLTSAYCTSLPKPLSLSAYLYLFGQWLGTCARHFSSVCVTLIKINTSCSIVCHHACLNEQEKGDNIWICFVQGPLKYVLPRILKISFHQSVHPECFTSTFRSSLSGQGVWYMKDANNCLCSAKKGAELAVRAGLFLLVQMEIWFA